MRKINFLFAFLLSMMGATQAWADYSISGPQILNSSEWQKESGRWNEYSGGIYDYAGGNDLSDTELISPMMTTTLDGQKVTINGYNNGGSYSVLKVYYSTDKSEWTLAKDLSSNMNATTGSAVDMSAEFEIEGNYYIKLVCNKVFIINFKVEEFETIPEMAVYSNAYSSPAQNGETKDFGLVTSAPSYTYYVKNVAMGTLTVDVTATEGITVSPATLSLKAGEQETVTVTPSVNGTITIYGKNGSEILNTFTASFKGDVLDKNNPAKFFEDFNGTSLTPVEGIDGWDVDVTTHDGASGYYGRMQYYDDNGTSVVFYYVTGDEDTPAYLITPKLHVNGTDDTFYLRTGGLSDGMVTVSYSADMNSWTEISNYASSGYTNKSFNNIPEGDYYIKIELWDGTIDYFYGLQLAQDEPATGMNIYMKANGWAADNARMLAWYWGEGNEGAWSDNLTAVEGEEDIYTVALPEGTTGLKFVRKSQDSALGWGSENNWNESANDIDVYDGAYYTMTGFNGFNGNDPIYGYYEQELTEAAENTDAIHVGTHHKMTVAFTMQAGKFAAICLPFATTTTALGEGVKAWAFTGYTDGNIDLSTTTELAAATPYIVYAENGINGLTFQNVTIESNEAGKVEQGAATFQGSYVKMAAGTMTDKYGVTPAGKIQKAGSGASMKAFRAYFEGITQGAKLVCDGEIIGEATGIDTIENAAQAGELYDLQGRRVMNAQKGLYIQNGKKVVMK